MAPKRERYRWSEEVEDAARRGKAHWDELFGANAQAAYIALYGHITAQWERSKPRAGSELYWAYEPGVPDELRGPLVIRDDPRLLAMKTLRFNSDEIRQRGGPMACIEDPSERKRAQRHDDLRLGREAYLQQRRSL